MKQSEALDNVHVMIMAIQKFRSVSAEEIPGLTDKIKNDLLPWVFGPQCPLESMANVVDRGTIETQSYYNFTYIMDRFMSPVFAATMFYTKDHETIPGIDQVGIDLIAEGWEPEE